MLCLSRMLHKPYHTDIVTYLKIYPRFSRDVGTEKVPFVREQEGLRNSNPYEAASFPGTETKRGMPRSRMTKSRKFSDGKNPYC